MWIARNEYNKLIEENASLKCKTREQGLRISKLLSIIDELNLKLYDNKYKCYDVILHIKGLRKVKYTVSAETHEEARKYVIEQFEKDNLALSKDDIILIESKEI